MTGNGFRIPGREARGAHPTATLGAVPEGNLKRALKKAQETPPAHAGLDGAEGFVLIIRTHDPQTPPQPLFQRPAHPL
jgi:hypothetical protein